MNSLILIQYKINFLGSWKPYEMKVFLSEPCSPSSASRSTVIEPSISRRRPSGIHLYDCASSMIG